MTAGKKIGLRFAAAALAGAMTFGAFLPSVIPAQAADMQDDSAESLSYQLALFRQTITFAHEHAYQARTYGQLTDAALKGVVKRADPDAGYINNGNQKSDDLAVQLALFQTVIQQSQRNAKEKVTFGALADAGLKAMLLALDPHSLYMNRSEWRRAKERHDGYSGIGAELSKEKMPGPLTITGIRENSPAEKSGLKEGDIITRIDAVSTDTLGVSEAAGKIRGLPGTRVDLSVQRGEKTFDVSIIRQIAKIASVTGRTIGTPAGPVAHIRIAMFNETTDSTLGRILREMEFSPGGAPVAYVLDLRGNRGGYLAEMKNVADRFLEAGEIYSLRGRNGKLLDAPVSARKGDDISRKKLAILTDRDTASAGELLAATLQHPREYLNGQPRAVVFGEDETTFGKGSYQNNLTFDTGETISMTAALYFAPEKTPQITGVPSDIKVNVPGKHTGAASPESGLASALSVAAENTFKGKRPDKICEATGKEDFGPELKDRKGKADIALACSVEFVSGAGQSTIISPRPDYNPK